MEGSVLIMNLKKIVALFFGALMMSSVALAAPMNTYVSNNPNGFNPLAGVQGAISQEFSVNIYTQILMTADLGDMIPFEPQGFTLFVPTDRSIMYDLTPERIQQLLTNKEDARFFTMFHMLKGRQTLANLEAMSGTMVTNMSNTPINMTTAMSPTGKTRILVNGARIDSDAFQGNNVTVYMIDTIMAQ